VDRGVQENDKAYCRIYEVERYISTSLLYASKSMSMAALHLVRATCVKQDLREGRCK